MEPAGDAGGLEAFSSQPGDVAANELPVHGLQLGFVPMLAEVSRERLEVRLIGLDRQRAIAALEVKLGQELVVQWSELHGRTPLWVVCWPMPEGVDPVTQL